MKDVDLVAHADAVATWLRNRDSETITEVVTWLTRRRGLRAEEATSVIERAVATGKIVMLGFRSSLVAASPRDVEASRRR